jgi:hypothetical protein
VLQEQGIRPQLEAVYFPRPHALISEHRTTTIYAAATRRATPPKARAFDGPGF